VMVADVVGYSRLMEADEAGTLTALKYRRKNLLEPTVRKYGGRVIKYMGDGVLVEFASAIAAVQASIELQHHMSEANAKAPAAPEILLRVGINLGDVIGEGADIYGDGVNVAARLERLAQAGGICISSKVHDEVLGKLAIRADDLGEIALKNIDRPVRAFAVEASHPAPSKSLVGAEAERETPTVAILPFTNMSNDAEQDYFSDGLTEDIITELSRYKSLNVIARNSSFAYRGKAKDIRSIGKELGAQYVVEGSVRRAADKLRVTAQLIQAETGNHIWADRYDRDLADVFALQDEIVTTIVGTLPGRIEEAHTFRTRRTAVKPAAYDYVLLGRQHLYKYKAESVEHAMQTFQHAIDLDANCAAAHAGKAQALLYRHASAAQDDTDLRAAVKEGERALALDRQEPATYNALSLGYVKSGRHRDAISLAERAVALWPSSGDSARVLGVCFVHAGRHDEGIEWLQRSIRLDRYQPASALEFLAEAYFFKHQFDRALELFHQIVDPPHWVLALIAATYAHHGDPVFTGIYRDRYAEVWSEIASDWNVVSDEYAWQVDIAAYAREADRLLYSTGLSKAGILPS
jgi:adenylate cyclase